LEGHSEGKMQEAKQDGALRTIGEVATDLGVATHVLRFWESKFSQIKPQKRRGRRYYRAEDVITIKTIKELLYDQGYTIKGVHKFLKSSKKEQAAALSSPAELDEPEESNFKRDLFGNIIAGNDDSSTEMPEFGINEIAKLKQIYKGICASRNKLNDVA
jgi:DNA-binding transcriptional MerR regulator